MATTRVRYILEAQYPNKTEKFILPHVGRINFSRAHAVHTTWTAGPIPYHQYSGVRSQTIELSGRSGLKEIFETPGYFDFSTVSADMSGPAIFRKLEKFLEKYENECYKAQQARAELPKLVFKALWEEKNLLVELESFSWVRDKDSSRLSYEWTLQLQSYADAGKIEPEGPMRWLSGATEVAAAVTKAINYANVAVAGTQRLLEDTRTTLDQFRQPIKAVANLGKQARLVAYQLDRLLRWPVDFMRDFWYATYELTAVAYDIWAALPFVDRARSRASLLDVMGSIGDARRATFTALGLNYEKIPSYTYSPEKKQGFLNSSDYRLNSRASALTMSNPLPGGYAIKNGQLVQVYIVKGGDTLQDIAQNILGDKSQWITIANINGMTSDDTLNDGSPMLVGSTIFVPVPGNTLPISGQNPNDLYGTDIMLTKDGDLELSGELGVDSTDIKLVKGMNNLLQAMRVRLLTFKGTNGTFPDYGIPSIIGDPGTVDRIANAALEIRAQFTSEQRIEELGDLVVVDDGDTLIVNAIVKPVVGQQFKVSVPLPTG